MVVIFPSFHGSISRRKNACFFFDWFVGFKPPFLWCQVSPSGCGPQVGKFFFFMWIQWSEMQLVLLDLFIANVSDITVTRVALSYVPKECKKSEALGTWTVMIWNIFFHYHLRSYHWHFSEITWNKSLSRRCKTWCRLLRTWKRWNLAPGRCFFVDKIQGLASLKLDMVAKNT